MKIVVQRVKKAKVDVNNKTVGEIDKGLLLLVSFTHNDTLDNIKYMVNKVINLRIFDDQNGVMNLSVKDVGGSILSVSQFTLYADCSKGNRPSYVNSMKAEEAKEMYEIFNEELKKEIKVETGIFQAEMEVSLINDGPITIILER
jgi:D-tyrosyl-tRNA(Tyr) deacylase